MSPAGELSWLCRLVDESLRSDTEPDTFVSMCKEKEKEILLNSSQVVTKIKTRLRGFDSNAEDATAKRAQNNDGLCCSNQHSSEHQCLHKIVAEMMILLTVKSEFVQHVAVNALVLTSQFVSTTGNNWDGFIHLLCCFLETAIARNLSYSSVYSSGAQNCEFDSSEVDFLMQYGLKNCDWSTVAGITQVLRVICKCLKEDYDDELVKVYYDSVNSCLLKLPWDLLDEFCDTVINLIPRLVKWCLRKQEDRAETCIIHYLKHKLLILMIRLGSLTCLDCSIRLSWLELLHNYFQELLRQPLTHFLSDQDDCLEGSPFLLSLSDGETHGMHSSHLQRQAVFLFLDCSFSLICQRGENIDHSIPSTLCSCLTTNPDSELDHFCTKKGLLEVYKWIQGHLPTEISVNHEKYLEICMNFMSSFLQLYLREDDLLFEVLLQLLSITSCLQLQFGRKEAAYRDIKKDFPFDLSDIFNPVHLFHLFLSEIHYDHQVLLDYLILKDTGICCAKYLLRCLHLICNSWKLFVKFPSFGELLKQSSCKRRKVLGDGLEFLADGRPSSVGNDGKHYNINPFKKASECLLSLNNSVENLHQKNLFPYNPEVLLKRLRRFQELCCREKGFHGQIN